MFGKPLGHLRRRGWTARGIYFMIRELNFQSLSWRLSSTTSGRRFNQSSVCYAYVHVCACMCVCVCVCMLSHVQLFVTPWTVALCDEASIKPQEDKVVSASRSVEREGVEASAALPCPLPCAVLESHPFIINWWSTKGNVSLSSVSCSCN